MLYIFRWSVRLGVVEVDLFNLLGLSASFLLGSLAVDVASERTFEESRSDLVADEDPYSQQQASRTLLAKRLVPSILNFLHLKYNLKDNRLVLNNKLNETCSMFQVSFNSELIGCCGQTQKDYTYRKA
jgi:hypothetical protein